MKLTKFQKRKIFNNSHKLKGTGVPVTKDLTIDQQKHRRILRRHLTLTRLDNRKSSIRRNKLIVDASVYKVEKNKEVHSNLKIKGAPQHLVVQQVHLLNK